MAADGVDLHAQMLAAVEMLSWVLERLPASDLAIAERVVLHDLERQIAAILRLAK